MDQAASPDQNQSEGQESGSAPKNPMDLIVQMGSAIHQIVPALQKAGAPPEALQKFQEADASFKDGIAILGGNAPSNGEEQGEQGSVPEAAPGQPQMARVPGRNIVPAKGGMGY